MATETFGGEEGKRTGLHFFVPTYMLGVPPCAPAVRAPEDKSIPWIPLNEQSYQTDLEVLSSLCDDKHKANGWCAWDHWGGTDKSLQDWHGVHTEIYDQGSGVIDWQDCNSKYYHCRVTRLELTGKDLKGSIPPQLGSLGQLKYLNLSDNQLSGSIPAQLGSLRNLYTLALNNNRLEGKIPAELGNLDGGTLDDGSVAANWFGLFGRQVLDLYLQHNNLSGTIPPELGNIGYLRDVDIDEDEFEGCLPSNTVLDTLSVFPKVAFTLTKKAADALKKAADIPSRHGIIADEWRRTDNYKNRTAGLDTEGIENYDEYVGDIAGQFVGIADELTLKVDPGNPALPPQSQLSLWAVQTGLELMSDAVSLFEKQFSKFLGLGNRDDIACDYDDLLER